MQYIFKKIGSWLFLVGLLIAIIAGVIVGANWYTDTNAYLAGLLGILGFVVGILSFFALGSITKERVPMFLLGALILVAIGLTAETWKIGANDNLVFFFQNITTYIYYFAAPAAGILAIRAIWEAGKTEEIEKVIPKIPE
jgi:hypothetical protein